MTELLLPAVWFDVEEEKKELVGEGAFGKVYKVTDPSGQISAVKIFDIPGKESELQNLKNDMRDPVALKTYLSDITTEFLTEIKMMEKLKDSRNIVRLKSHYVEEKADGYGFRVYIQMEFLHSIHSFYDQKKMEEKDVIQIGIDICHALVDCAKKNIIHRDIKPDNIMVDEEGHFRLGDFGIARHMERTLGTLSQKGTFTYMAPEVYHGAKYGKTVDIYSLGLVLYHYLNKGRDPFIDPDKKLIRYKDKENALKNRMDGVRIPPPKHGSEELVEIIGRAVAFRVEDRYQDAEDMLRDLMDLQRGAYRMGKTWANKGIVHRAKRFYYHHKYKLAAGLVGVICVAGGLELLMHYKKDIKVEKWTPQTLQIRDEEKAAVCQEVEVFDDMLWEILKEKDWESFQNLCPSHNQEEFQHIYRNYYMLEDKKDGLENDYDKYIDQYQEGCERYSHVISKEGNTCFVEVCRYTIEKDESDYTNLKKLEDYYQGHLLQATLYYEVDLQENEVQNVDLFSMIPEKEDSQNTIFAHIHAFDDWMESQTEGAWISQFSEGFDTNFLFMEPDFYYDHVFRVDPMAYSINEKDKTITFAVTIKNGMEQDVEIKTLHITYQMGNQAEDFPGDDENYNMNLWVKNKQTTCILLTYPLKKTDEIDMDTYRRATGVRIDFQNNLEGVEKE